MSESILISTKAALGIDANYDAFNDQIIMAINTALSVVYQLGVGDEPKQITGVGEVWSDIIGDDKALNIVKTYVYLKTKIVFDPPTVGVLHEAMERMLSELEWRINVQVEGRNSSGESS